ncbi:MAG: hypothetical protein Q7J32_06985 [Sphingomonadaceae bacterium]|nr:hypothetical protein [Sphingomonadaceae bacterium]
MQKNFSIGAMGAEVIVGERAIDLHNLYSTTRISTDMAGEMITLVFERDHRWEGPSGLPEKVTLKGFGSLKIAFNDLAGQAVLVPEDAVEVAYYDADCPWDHFLDEHLAATQGFEGLHISFSGGLVLRIHCNTAEVTTS